MQTTVEGQNEPVDATCDECKLVAAYLDGELDEPIITAFESHVKDCAICAGELAMQRRLLCALDIAVNGSEKEFALPRNFAKIITTRAQADMRGLRSSVERCRALFLCGALAFIALILMKAFAGGATLEVISTSLLAGVRVAWSIARMISHFIVEAFTGIAVVLRALGSYLFVSSNMRGALMLMLFAFAFVALFKLLERYHRLPRIPE